MDDKGLHSHNFVLDLSYYPTIMYARYVAQTTTLIYLTKLDQNSWSRFNPAWPRITLRKIILPNLECLQNACYNGNTDFQDGQTKGRYEDLGFYPAMFQQV